MTPTKRERVLKIRVTDDELARLKGLSGDERLAEWMRSQCLGNDKAAGRRRTPVPKADPALLRQIAGIGNNLNQVARRVNSGEWGAVERVQVIAVLMAMERALQALSAPSTEVTCRCVLRHRHPRCQSKRRLQESQLHQQAAGLGHQGLFLLPT